MVYIKMACSGARFLPAIALIKQHTQIVNVDSGIDYRLRTLTQAEIYHAPLDAAASSNLHSYFQALSQEPRHAGAVMLKLPTGR